MPKLTENETAAIREFFKSRDPILCATGSTACNSIDVSTKSVTYKPILYFGRSANRQRIISSNARGIKSATESANRVIHL